MSASGCRSSARGTRARQRQREIATGRGARRERTREGDLQHGQPGRDALQGGGLPRGHGDPKLGAHPGIGRGCGFGAGGGKRRVQFRLAEGPRRRRRARRALQLARWLEPGEVERRRRALVRRAAPGQRGIARGDPLARTLKP
jgi:hypothetical protein